MRILFIKRLFGPVGGSESLTYSLATGLAARGHDVRVACCWPPRNENRYRPERAKPVVREGHRVFWDHGVEVIQIRPRGGLLGSALDWTTLVDLMPADLLDAYAADRDIVHNVCREYLESAAAAARRARAAFVLTPIPHPGQFHGGDTPTDLAHYRSADAITAMTEWERRWYARHRIDITRVVTTGLSHATRPQGGGADFRRRHGIPPDAPIVLFIGRKERYKGYIQILDATDEVWRHFPDARFVFIGIQGWYSTFIDDFERYRDERIVDIEYAPAELKGAALDACDVFCMPSQYESFGIAYLEAWSYGKPVVACDIPVCREVVSDGVDGILVPQRAHRVAEAILRLLRDGELRASMGRAGQAKLHRYTWERALERTEEAYRLALAHRTERLAERALA